MAFRTTYISCVARLFRYMAERYFLCLSRTDSCREELSPSDPIESVCQLLQPLALVNLLLPVPPIRRLCSHFRFRSQSDSIRHEDNPTQVRCIGHVWQFASRINEMKYPTTKRDSPLPNDFKIFSKNGTSRYNIHKKLV